MHSLLKVHFCTSSYNILLCCVVLYSLNFRKPVHVQKSSYCHSTLPTTTFEQSDITSGLLLMEYHFWARKIRWTLDFLIPISWEHCLNDFFGDRAKPEWLLQHSRYQWNFSFFRTNLSAHLAPFHRLQTCLGFLLLLPLSMVVHKIQASNVVALQQHSPLSNNTSVPLPFIKW